MNSCADPPPFDAPSLEPHKVDWRLIVVLLGVLALVAFCRPARQHHGGGRPVLLTGEGSQGFVTLELKPTEDQPPLGSATTEIPWQAGMTVYDATLQAGRTKPKDWQSRWQGTGEMVFLLELGRITNQGADGLNWLFEINEKRIDRGAGAQTLESGDRLLWKMGKYE